MNTSILRTVLTTAAAFVILWTGTGCNQPAPTGPSASPGATSATTVQPSPGSPLASPGMTSPGSGSPAPTMRASGSPATASASPSGKVHHAQGTVKSIATDRLSADIDHKEIPTLKMGAMTMPYKMKDARVLEGVQPGDRVDFVVVETPPDNDLVVTEVKKAP